MYSLRDILPLTIQKLGLQRRYNAESAIQHWKQIVGDKIATYAVPVMVQRRVLLIAVVSPVWGHHLSMMKGEILQKINDFIGEQLIDDIRFQAGNYKNSPNQESNEQELSIQQQTRLVKLEEKEINTAYDLVQKIQDEPLRNKLFRIIKNDLRLKKVRIKNHWHPCSCCKSLCPPKADYCEVCSREQKEKVINEVYRSLSEAPWLSFPEIERYIKCSRQDFSLGRERLLMSILRNIHKGQADKLQILSLVMLTSGVKPEEVTDELVTKTLEKYGGKKHVFTSRG